MTDFSQLPQTPSPCVQNCCLDDNDICLGCFRSLEEITSWSGADEATRAQYLTNIEERKKAYLK